MCDDSVRHPSEEDSELFTKLAKNIADHADFYKGAGDWLDQNFSNKAIEDRKRSEREILNRRAKTGRTDESKKLIEELAEQADVAPGDLERTAALSQVQHKVTCSPKTDPS